MTLLDLSTNIRGCLIAQGGREIPSFPEYLPQPWLHPDFLARCFSGESWNLFSLQPICGEKLPFCLSETFNPTLVWMKKPFSVEWLHRIPGFLTSVLGGFPSPSPEERGSPDPKSYLEIWGTGKIPGLFADIGCRWNLAWKGVPIGQVKLVTGLFEESLLEPVGFLMLDLLALLCILHQEADSATAWCENISVKDLLAWRYANMEHTAETKSPPGEKRFEELREAAETALAEKHWLNAFHQLLKGLRGLSHSSLDRASRKMLQSVLEAKFKPVLRKIAALLSPKSGAGAKKGKEAAAK